MKPIVDMKRCFASQSVCKAIKSCPADAISYIEVDEPILDKTLSCNCAPPTEEAPVDACDCDGDCPPQAADEPHNSCDCDGDCGNDLYSCGGTPYGRIIIDYDKCTMCGICAVECCGTAIDMVG